MKTMKFCSTLALGLAFTAGAVMAHHSTNGIYDEEHPIEIVGTVKSWRFINPHPFLTVEAPDETGTMREWDVSYGGAAVVHMRRQGYAEDSFKPGDVIKVVGPPAKAKGAYGILVERNHPTRADGTPIISGR